MGVDFRILNVVLSKSKFDVTLYGIEANVTLRSIDLPALSKILSKLLKKFDIINVQLDLQHINLALARGNKRVYISINWY
ncbi:MAG: hypothetical protein RXR43_16405 [Sulfolobus sp.]